MLQKIDLIGNLVADAEVKTRKDNSEYISFRVAAHETMGEERKTTYYEISMGKSKVIEFLKKGQQVFISGKLSLSINTKDDRTYLNAHVSAKDLILCAPPRD